MFEHWTCTLIYQWLSVLNSLWWTMKFPPLVFVPCSYFSWESFVSGQTLFSSYIAFNHCEDLSKLFERLQICLFLHLWTCWKVVFVNGLRIWIITSIYWKCFFFFHIRWFSPTIWINLKREFIIQARNFGRMFTSIVLRRCQKFTTICFFSTSPHVSRLFFFRNTIHEVIQSRNQEENSLNYLNLDFLS